jgi:hypothetical protein
MMPKIVGFAGPVATRALPPRFILRFQQTVGNREVVLLLAPPPALPTRAVAAAVAPAPPMTCIARIPAAARRLWRRGGV